MSIGGRFAVVAVLAIGTAWADTWPLPVERDYVSENREFVAHVTPAKEGTPARVELSRVDGDQRGLAWTCSLGNEGAPENVYLTNDGAYVVTVNERSGRVHGGMGDFVLAFYARGGLIRNYSLEKLLHADQRSRSEFEQLVSRSTAGRFWTSMQFLIESDAETAFCVWLAQGRRWLAWDVANGRELPVDQELTRRCDGKARQWALGEISHPMSGSSYIPALETLGRLKQPEDRATMESLLHSEDFQTGHTATNRHLNGYYGYSGKRNAAELALAQYDDRLVDRRGGVLS